MLVKEITIDNYRSFYGHGNVIPIGDGLTLLIGANGDGKTTFFDALNWLFDTNSNNTSSPDLVSAKREKELNLGENDVVKVGILFEHDGEEKIVEKSFSFYKDLVSKQLKTGKILYSGFECSGSERVPVDGKRLLDACFEPAIRNYCLFKGEEHLNVFSSPNALSFLVEKFSEVRRFESFYDEKETDFLAYAIEQAEKLYNKTSNAEKKNSKLQNELKSEIEDLRRERDDKRIRLRQLREDASIYTDKINEVENNQDMSETIAGYNTRIEQLANKRASITAKIHDDYTIRLLDDNWIMCGFPAIMKRFQDKASKLDQKKRELQRDYDKKEGKKELIEDIKEGIKTDPDFVPLSVMVPDQKTMQELLDAEFCKVCGRPAKKGSEAYKFMEKKLNALLEAQKPKKHKESEPLFKNAYISELTQISTRLDYRAESINSLKNVITEDYNFNEERKKEVKECEEKIRMAEEEKKKLLAQSSLPEEQLLNVRTNYTNWIKRKTEAENRIPLLESREKELSEIITEKENKLMSLDPKSLSNLYKTIEIMFSNIREAFGTAKSRNIRAFLDDLENTANNYLQKLNVEGFYGIINIIQMSDGKAKIILKDKNDEVVKKPNQALETTVYMSVLFAVAELTTIKRSNDYPLIFDAPTSSFEARKERDFFNIIDGIQKQCIIVTKSFLDEDGHMDMEKIDSLKCSVYRIQKKKGFDKKDLSTIQTIVERIK